MTSTPSPQAGIAHSGSEEAHTPGPWSQAHRKGADGMHSTEVFDERDEVIATLGWAPREIGRGITASDRDANARLIAAAPELLLALKRSLDWLASYQGGGTLGPTGPYEQARAAITKATEPK